MTSSITKPVPDSGFATIPLGVTNDAFVFEPAQADGLAIEGVEVGLTGPDADGLYYPCGIPFQEDGLAMEGVEVGMTAEPVDSLVMEGVEVGLTLDEGALSF